MGLCFQNGVVFVSVGLRRDQVVLAPLLQRRKRRLLSAAARRHGDTVAPCLRTPSAKTLGALGGRGEGRPAVPQPVHVQVFRGGDRLLRSGARNVSLKPKLKGERLQNGVSWDVLAAIFISRVRIYTTYKLTVCTSGLMNTRSLTVLSKHLMFILLLF